MSKQKKNNELSTLFEDKIITFLKANNLDVEDLRTTPTGKARQNLPDLFCKQLGYLEPTVARCDRDGFSKLEYNPPVFDPDNLNSPVFGCVPPELIEKQQSLLASRNMGRLQEKEQNIKRYYKEKRIRRSQPCFVCLSIDTEGFSEDYFDENFIEDTLTRAFYQINTNEMQVSQGGSWYTVVAEPFTKPKLDEKIVHLETGLFSKSTDFENIAGVLFIIPKPIRTSDNESWRYDCLYGESIEYTNKDMFFFWNPNAKIMLGKRRINTVRKLKFKKNYA